MFHPKRNIAVSIFLFSTIFCNHIYCQPSESQFTAKENQQTIRQLFAVAKTVRPDSLDKPQQKPYIDIAKKLKTILPDYTTENNLDETIIHFIHKTLGLQITQKQMDLVQEGQAGGCSGNCTFMIQDTNKIPILVVKAFQNPYETNNFCCFVKEASAFDIASSLPNKELNLILIKSVGRCIIDKKDFTLATLSLAPGKMLNDYVTQMIAHPHNSKERQTAFNEIKNAIYKLGKAFAELHNTRTGQNCSLHRTFKHYILESYRKTLKRLDKDNHEIPVKKLKNCFHDLLNQIETQKITRSFSYGDAHFGNIMYEPTKEIITLIDLASLHGSADQELNPIGTPALDYSRMLDTIRMYTLYGLTLDESDTLETSFRNGYVDNNGIMPTPLEMKFFTLFNSIWLLGWLLKQIEKKSPLVNESFKQFTKHQISQVKGILL
jgi:hypothetical protein